MPSRMRTERFRQAQQDLEFYFGGADAVLGLHGSGFESSGVVVWDAMRIDHAHTAPRMLRHRHQMRDLAEIGPKVRAMSLGHWRTAMLAYCPRGWPAKLQTALSLGPRGGNLVGLALSGKALRDVWCKREAGRREAMCRQLYKAKAFDLVIDLALEPVEPTTIQLLEFAATEAENNDVCQVSAFFRPIRLEGERTLESALMAYDAIYRGVHSKELEGARAEAAA